MNEAGHKAGPDWSDGYPAQTTYFDTAQPAMSPLAMDLAALVAGRRPPSDGVTFRYLELGCGTGFTLIALAALYPEAWFTGVDFMPEHVARARALADEAGLRNVEFIEASFAQLAAGPEPEAYDYAALYGVWTWVSPENQAHIRAILGHWLRPGGLVVFGYNAAAGWMAAGPLRRIFREAPSGPAEDPLGPARAAAEAWVKMDAAEHVAAMWEKLSAMPDRYLAHDLGAEHGTTVWHSDLCRALAPAKLDHVGPVALSERFDGLRFRGAKLDFVQRAEAEGWGQAARDIAAHRTFRVDLFSRGAPQLTNGAITRRLRALPVRPWPPILAFEHAEQKGLAAFDDGIAEKVDTALTDSIHTLGDFADALGMDPTPALQVGLLTLARDALRAVRRPDDPGMVTDLHKALAEEFRDGVRVPGLAAPVLGAALPLSHAELRAALIGEGMTDDLRAGFDRLGLPVPS